jgi:hypothetical protein
MRAAVDAMEYHGYRCGTKATGLIAGGGSELVATGEPWRALVLMKKAPFTMTRA